MQTPDFDSIKQISLYGVDYWSARDLMPLLGYTTWRNFEVAINKAKTACEQVSQNASDQFVDADKLIVMAKGAQRSVNDYLLSRFTEYECGQVRQFVQHHFPASSKMIATGKGANREIQERLRLREQVIENNKSLASASSVLSKTLAHSNQRLKLYRRSSIP